MDNGTNVYNGLAYVWDENGKFYTYNVETEEPCKKIKSIKKMTLDYLGRFQEVTGQTKTIPYQTSPYAGNTGLSPKEENGLYGFSTGDRVVVPSQFTYADAFIDNNAVVGFNGQLGIVSYVAEGAFDVDVKKQDFRFYAGNKISCGFTLGIPNIWQGKAIEVKVKDETGNIDALPNDADSYTFTVSPKVTARKTYTVSVYGEGILLMEKGIEYSFEKRVKCNTCGKDVQDCVYKGKHQDEEICKDCGKPVKDCKYGGVHY